MYVSESDTTVHALAASTGAQSWGTSPLGSGLSSPVVANGVVYLGDSNGRIEALSSSTGALLANPSIGTDAMFAAPVVSDGVIYAGDGLGKLRAFGLP